MHKKTAPNSGCGLGKSTAVKAVDAGFI